jgi:hypothetical protein
MGKKTEVFAKGKSFGKNLFRIKFHLELNSICFSSSYLSPLFFVHPSANLHKKEQMARELQ